MADFEYFRAEESDQFSFFRIPKALFTEKEFASPVSYTHLDVYKRQGGKLNISKGMVSRLSREFALKTEAERKAVYTDMLLSPVMLDGFSCFPVYTIGILKSS